MLPCRAPQACPLGGRVLQLTHAYPSHCAVLCGAVLPRFTVIQLAVTASRGPVALQMAMR
jgi:hypothetical protein